MAALPAQRRNLVIAFVIAVITLAVYWPVHNFGFVSYDDPDYVTRNSHVKNGLSGESVVWALTRSHSCNWHPVTWISHMVDCQIFGLDAGAHHLVNVTIHAVTATLLFVWLLGVTGDRWRSALVSALFAWHPLHVESVAWISERKDVLSGLFFVLTLLAYRRYLGGNDRRWYLGTLALYALGLMSKSMLVTLPCVLLLLDIWPYRRWNIGNPKLERDGGIKNTGTAVVFSKLLREKIPFFILAMVSATITASAQRAAMASTTNITFTNRLANGLVAYASYLRKTFWPDNLAAIYPLSSHTATGAVVGASAVLGLITIMVIRIRHRQPQALVGWLWYLGMLVPVIGLVQVGSQSMADRYTYLPLLGIFIGLVWLIPDLRPNSQPLVAGVGIAALAACVVLSSRQVAYWRDAYTLFEHAAKVVPRNYIAECALGNAMLLDDKFDDAIRCYQAALTYNPKSTEALQYWGLALMKQDRAKEANELLARALAIEPGNLRLQTAFAGSLASMGDTDGARTRCLELLKNHPDQVDALVLLGNTYALNNRTDDAFAAYQRAIHLDPDNPEALVGLSVVFYKRNQLPDSISTSLKALQIEPRLGEAQYNLARALVAQGKLAEAVPHFLEALRGKPGQTEIRLGFAAALSQLDRYDEATMQSSEVLRRHPENVTAHNTLAYALMSLGRLPEAIQHFEESLRLNPGQSEAHSGEGMALGRLGRYAEAIPHYQKAITVNPADADTCYNLALALAGTGNAPAAISAFRDALRLKPGWNSALNALAWLLATHEDSKIRNGAEAVEFASVAVRQAESPNAMYLNTLAAAQAELGQFDQAVATAQKAVTVANALEQKNLAAQIAARLRLYQEHKPFRDPSLSPKR